MHGVGKARDCVYDPCIVRCIMHSPRGSWNVYVQHRRMDCYSVRNRTYGQRLCDAPDMHATHASRKHSEQDGEGKKARCPDGFLWQKEVCVDWYTGYGWDGTTTRNTRRHGRNTHSAVGGAETGQTYVTSYPGGVVGRKGGKSTWRAWHASQSVWSEPFLAQRRKNQLRHNP